MKQSFTFLFATLLLLISTTSFAKIWRVNNNAGITADFTTAQAAHNAASAGDTIHLEPSNTTYGGLSTSKPLVWLSTGEFLSANPGLQYSTTPGRINDLNVNAGSQNSVFSIRFNYSYCYVPNVTFSRCYVDNWINLSSGASNSVVINCYVNSYVQVTGSTTNVIINNNIIRSNVHVDNASSAIITNNVINGGNSSGTSINNSQIQNNVFSQANSDYTFTNCNINNNMANRATLLPAGNGNVNSVDMSSVFENYQATTDAGFVLKAGSPAKSTGYGGVDMGAFGGSSPYLIALQPAIPAIYQMSAPAAPNGSTMNVTFSTKSNN